MIEEKTLQDLRKMARFMTRKYNSFFNVTFEII